MEPVFLIIEMMYVFPDTLSCGFFKHPNSESDISLEVNPYRVFCGISDSHHPGCDKADVVGHLKQWRYIR